MKLLQTVAVVCVIVIGTLAWAAYPSQYSEDLYQGLQARVRVDKHGDVQTAEVWFLGEAGPCMCNGSLTVSSMSPVIRNQKCYCGEKELIIDTITLQSATPMNQGRVMFRGSLTDTSGELIATFNLSLCEWAY